MTRPYAERLAQFVAALRWSDIAPLRQKRLRWAAADFFACTAAGAASEDARLADPLAHPGAVKVPGRDAGFAMDGAVLVMGTVGALLQAHDLYRPGGLHGSSTIIPAAWLAWSPERQPVTDLLTAVAAGYEVANRLGAMTSPHQAGGGAAATATMGAIGAAAALAKLQGLAVPAIAAAISIAATYAPLTALGALREHATVSPLHNGLAARTGYEAVQMACAGLDAGSAVFEGHYQPGLIAFLGGPVGAERLAASRPEDWRLETIDQVFFKDLPACARNQAILKAALGLVTDAEGHPLGAAQPFAAAEITAIRVIADPATANFDHLNAAPFGLYDRLMSIRWGVASTLAHGDYGLANLDHGGDEPAVRALLPRITVQASAEFAAGGNRLPGARVEIDAGGRQLAAERRLNYDLPLEAGWFTPYCTPATSLDENGMKRKFFAFAGRTLAAEDAAATLDRLLEGA